MFYFCRFSHLWLGNNMKWIVVILMLSGCQSEEKNKQRAIRCKEDCAPYKAISFLRGHDGCTCAVDL